MALPDDGDLIKALGYVAMYAAWLEEDVDDILRIMAPAREFDCRVQKLPISRKLRHARDIVELLNSDELDDLVEALMAASDIFEMRNELIHGRIYADPQQGELLKSGRVDIETRQITSAEIYAVADQIWAFRGAFIGPQAIRLPRGVSEYLKQA
jgi:hypothetical protein